MIRIQRGKLRKAGKLRKLRKAHKPGKLHKLGKALKPTPPPRQCTINKCKFNGVAPAPVGSQVQK
jgi:hypothetical protein